MRRRTLPTRTLAALALLAGLLVAAPIPAGAAGERCPEPGTGRVVECFHVVRRGKWLWSIARDNLRADFGVRRPAGHDIRTRAAELHALNRAAIGADPDRLRVGTRLRMYPWAGAPTVLDPTYGGGDGLAELTRAGRYADARALALDADGRAVTAGQLGTDIAVARFTVTGAPDLSFGDGGLVRTTVGSSARAAAVAAQPDGRIVVAGSAGVDARSDVVVVRYLPDGKLDASFGVGGVVQVVFGGYASATAVALQPDGRIVVAGSASGDEADLASDVVVLRLLADGRPDPAFGTAGRSVLDVAGGVDVADGVVLLDDGRIVVAGSAAPGPGSGEFDALLAGFLPDGAPDFTVVTDYGSPFDSASAVTTAPGGTLVTAGSMVRDRITSEIVLARHGVDGGLLGLTATPTGEGSDGSAVAVLPDGTLLVAGQAGGAAVLLRHAPNGVLRGIDRTPFGGDRSAAFGLVVDDAGRALAGGCTCDGSNTSTRGGFELPSAVVVARYR